MNEEVKAAPPEAAVATEDEQDLDSLLSEFDEKAVTPPPEEKTPPPVPTDEVKSFMDRVTKKENDEALAKAAKTMKEAIGDVKLSDEWFEGRLWAENSRDPRIGDAFAERLNNPGRWDSIVKGLAAKLKKEVGHTDQASTASWDAVQASQGAASSAPAEEAEPNFNAMSDNEFLAWKTAHQ